VAASASAPDRDPAARRPGADNAISGLMPDAMSVTQPSLDTLRRRADFLAANGALRVVTPGFILLVRRRDDDAAAMRIGYTVTRKIGGAVVRNRMKRRFRAMARAILPEHGMAGADHVLIGRDQGIERDFAQLCEELRGALTRVRAGKAQRDRGGSGRPRRR